MNPETLFLILCALIAVDHLLTHLVIKAGGNEASPILKIIIGARPSGRALIAAAIVKCGAFGYLMILTDDAALLHQGLIIGTALVVAWNIWQLYKVRQ